MRSETNVVILATIFVFVCRSDASSKVRNVTEWLRGARDPKLRDNYVPVARDVSYLREENYIDDHEVPYDDAKYFQREDRNLMPEYRNLCETVTRKVQTSDSNYEYLPPHYHEVFCKSYSLLDRGDEILSPSQQKCAHPGFHCVQRSRTLFMVRRKWESECWEPITKEIASGCDCMWPVSVLGDITMHY